MNFMCRFTLEQNAFHVPKTWVVSAPGLRNQQAVSCMQNQDVGQTSLLLKRMHTSQL